MEFRSAVLGRQGVDFFGPTSVIHEHHSPTASHEEGVLGLDDLRGYSQGEFRGNQLYDIQAEWRQIVHKRFGMVGFIGVGTVLDELSDLGDAPWLPGGGIGFRYRMIKSEKINIGMDVGVGKNDWSLSFRIGESFSR